VTEKLMTLEEVADYIESHGYIRAAFTIRAHRCEPDPSEYVRVSDIRKVLERGSYLKLKGTPDGYPGSEVSAILSSDLEAILPKPKRDALEELEAALLLDIARLVIDEQRAQVSEWLALVRQAKAERGKP
jgi:hypothetical protein